VTRATPWLARCSPRARFGPSSSSTSAAPSYKRPLTVALHDVDGFRAINLRHGYAVGDEVLAAIGNLISEQTRVNDLACRMGGDEFALLLPETNAEAAVQLASRTLVPLEDIEAGPLRGLSVSIGIAELEENQPPEGLLAAAGEALQQARAGAGGQAAVFAGTYGEQTGHPAHGDIVAALASALQERDDVLHKPGPLDEREWELMRQHPVIGERILRMIPGLGAIARIVRHEHERWDGTGYPDGLVGDATPIGARIILACDAYHAMTSDRPYRPAMAHADAVRELTHNAGSQFDPEVVQALVSGTSTRSVSPAPPYEVASRPFARPHSCEGPARGEGDHGLRSIPETPANLRQLLRAGGGPTPAG
jgi:diguanylate cyclase (GGDEF)-like protein